MTDDVNTVTRFDQHMDRIAAGDWLGVDEVQEWTGSADILPLGMLADTLRRRIHGSRTTYVRVAFCTLDDPTPGSVASAGEIRLTGAPETLDQALGAVTRVRAVAGGRTVAGFSWGDVEQLAEAAGAGGTRAVLHALRAEGLDALAELALDKVADLSSAVDELASSGFERIRLTIDHAPAAERSDLFWQAAALQERFGCIQTLSPLPMGRIARPSTGYEDVKMVAIARLAARNVPSIQVDWARYGPKLAQVALTFGADDVYGIAASDEAPGGRRRAPVEEIRRNIEAAGLEPVERDGRFFVSARHEDVATT
jgi:hypothetical protein